MFLKRSAEAIVEASDDPAAPILRARGVHKSYSAPGGRLHVLHGVDLEVQRGTLLAIVGASGSGKSTLLNILGTLDHADEGTLEVGGRRLDRMSERERCSWRARRLGFVFQFHHLLSEFTAEENVMMPLLVAGESFERARARARETLAWVGLDERRDHLPSELSGGEAQRVAVARAISPSPDLILADEPSGNLDAVAAGRLHSLLSSLTRERHQTVVLVTHNDTLAAQADRVLKLDAGRLGA
jgi:lipoprotein-releasing system ATP-binding protein